MPEGVEHQQGAGMHGTAVQARTALMPEGVEHFALRAVTRRVSCENRFDAGRR